MSSKRAAASAATAAASSLAADAAASLASNNLFREDELVDDAPEDDCGADRAVAPSSIESADTVCNVEDDDWDAIVVVDDDDESTSDQAKPPGSCRTVQYRSWTCTQCCRNCNEDALLGCNAADSSLVIPHELRPPLDSFWRARSNSATSAAAVAHEILTSGSTRRCRTLSRAKTTTSRESAKIKMGRQLALAVTCVHHVLRMRLTPFGCYPSNGDGRLDGCCDLLPSVAIPATEMVVLKRKDGGSQRRRP